MSELCTVKKIFKAKEVVEGAGVKVNRVFGYFEVNNFDPFLLLDHFKSDNEDDFKAGFPFHPHRGIETVSYLKKGRVEHRDKLGNVDVLKEHQVQWMTAGSGIYHQEMPLSNEGIDGFQLWLNLPGIKKMTGAEYRTFTSLPVLKEKDFNVTIICGKYKKMTGPGTGISTQNPNYFDIECVRPTKWKFRNSEEHNSFIYVYNGGLTIDKRAVFKGEVALLSDGKNIEVETTGRDTCFLYISGSRINEPISWWGPIVMNSKEEIEQAKRDLTEHNFY